MPLRLRQAIAGRPNLESERRLDVITVGDRGYIVYPSASSIVLLTPELELAETLQFWSALPHRASTSSPGKVQGVCCSTAEGLILAWSDVHVVLWRYLSSKGNAGWTVHSTVVATSSITCLDFVAGTLVIGSRNGIEFWRMDPQAEVVVWDRLWERSYPSPRSICLSPASGHIAWYEEGQKSVHILATDRKGQAVGMAQELRHPRDIGWIGWRNPTSGSTDSHLYTITTNSVFRIYSPVLDDPLWFQLLSSMDHKAFSRAQNPSDAKGKAPEAGFGTIWVWNAQILRQAVAEELDQLKQQKERGSPVIKTLEALQAEESDVVAWVGPDGTMVIRSIVNMERKPPTLLKSLPLATLKLPAGSPVQQWSSHARLLHIPGPTPSLVAALAPTDRNPSIEAYRLSLADIFASRSAGITLTAHPASPDETTPVQLEHPIDHFVRTPNGRGLLAIAEHGEIGTWYKQQLSLRPGQWRQGPNPLLGKGHWTAPTSPSQAATFAKGRALVFYTSPPEGPPEITLQHLDRASTSPAPPVVLPHFSPTKGDEVEMLLAVSDIDDGYSNKGRRTQRAIIMAATRSGEAWVWRVISRITPKEEQVDERPDVILLSHYRLPTDTAHPNESPRMIMPVDPMGWHQSVIDWTTDTCLQDMVLTISNDGDLEFWIPRIGSHLAGDHASAKKGAADMACHALENGSSADSNDPWIKTGVVKTDRRNVIAARCSSRKKTALGALVCELPDGRHEMTIWDSKVSEFSIGLELTHIFGPGEEISDLDWTTTSDLQSVLAVGFAHKVVLVCEQRMSYAEVTPGWAPFLTIDMERYTSLPISDSIWLAGGSLAVGAGNQIYLFSRFLGRDTPTPSPAGSARSVQMDEEEPEDIFQLIAHRNGPLVDYHPVQLGQCLLWDKADLVKNILLQLDRSLRDCQEEGRKRLRFPRLDPAEFYSRKKIRKAVKSTTNKYDGLFDAVQPTIEEDDDDFTERVVSELIHRLNGSVTMPLTSPEKSFLATVIQATLEAEQQRRSLDICGMRYLISLRMYVNWDRLSSAGTDTMSTAATSTTVSHSVSGDAGVAGRQKHHFSFRNIVWATHSESHDLLLSASTQTCNNGKMMWEDAKRMGVFLWLKPGDVYKTQLENVARNRFMADDDRDPTSCSLIFFALGKKKVVHGLWRQAPGHREQTMMLKFLANDFELDRWKTAAVKNAYALLSKQRYEYAAAFFMLAAQPKDAINICLRHLKDWQLGVALARVVDSHDSRAGVGPLLKWILEDTVLPIAFEGGHRWLATWAFWTLGRRDLAVRILISPMLDVALDFSPEHPLDVGNPDNDDPSLLLMFQHLKTKSLQTAKGTSEVSTKLEFDFVLHNARVFFRMGCHNLALDLLRSWSFDRPFFPTRANRSPIASGKVPSTPLTSAAPITVSPQSPTRPSLFTAGSYANANVGSGSYIGQAHKRRPSFMLTSGGRRESLFMDMDVLAESTANSSAVPTPTAEKPDPTPASVNGEGVSISSKQTDGQEPGPTELNLPPVKADTTVSEEPAQTTQAPRKIGNLMKELKQDVQQGAMDFNMDNFF
ncbi:hypothetical protein IAU59_001141 [Kwoniella sp. CBS 9459]